MAKRKERKQSELVERLRTERDALRTQVSDLERQLEETDTKDELEAERDKSRQLSEELKRALVEAELSRLRALEAERHKWETRETDLVAQRKQVEHLLEEERKKSRGPEDTSSVGARAESDKRREDITLTPPEGHGTALEALSSTHWMSQQLPQLTTFSGDDLSGVGETFVDWAEQFEMIAKVLKWDEDARMVHLVTRLKGPAAAFYRSCPASVKSTYASLKSELERRFTPVRLPTMQASLFHKRRQKDGETVDEFAQDLRKLFCRAYPQVKSGGTEAGEIGKTVLTNQFVVGLRMDIQEKLTGVDGDMEQLLCKARFEEAKKRELSHDRRAVNARPEKPATDRLPEKSSSTQSSTRSRSSSVRCWKCGGRGHVERDCTSSRRAVPRETQARGSSVATLNSPATTTIPPQVEKEVAKLHALTPAVRPRPEMGPKYHLPVTMEGKQTAALVDTGSPLTIVSLTFIIQAWWERKRDDQPKDEWTREMNSWFLEPSVTLQTYNGDPLSLFAETKVLIESHGRRHQMVVLVQDEAPQDLLLGTDALTHLGLSMEEMLRPSTAAISEECTSSPPNPSPTLKLLTAARIPAGFGRAMKATVDGHLDSTTMLLEPSKSLLIESALLELDSDGCVTLVVKNPGQTPLDLDVGEVLGTVQEADLYVTPQEVEPQVNKVTCNNPFLCNRLTVAEERTRYQQLCNALQVDVHNLTLEQRDQVMTLVTEYADVFALDGESLGSTQLVQHRIETGDSPPIRQYVRRVPHALKERVQELIQDMMEKGVIQPSCSPWASPVVLVAKRDGSTRFCVDYRRLNSITKKDVYPLPRIDDYLDTLAGAQYFSTLDLSSGYWQVQMHPDSKEKTAFVTHAGSYQFNVMPFGLCTAPATFQRLMENVLAGLVPHSCLDYIDDILVYGSTFEQHQGNLRKVFERLRVAGLKLKPRKCRLAAEEVCYLGYTVSRKGVATDDRKTAAVREFPRPSNLKQLRSFIGLTSYYRRFIPNYSRVARVLHDLTKKDVVFQWTETCEEAFVQLKKLLTEAPILAFPDFTRPFILETDASSYGLGAVLAQVGDGKTVHPLAYASRTLQGAEHNYAVTELEALGVVWAVRHFRHYLYGHRCTVYTDHQALKALLNTPHPSGKLARWGLTLQELDLEIVYRPGRSNGNADALSRQPIPLPSEAGVLTRVSAGEDDDLSAHQRTDGDARSGDGRADAFHSSGGESPGYHTHSLVSSARGDPDWSLSCPDFVPACDLPTNNTDGDARSGDGRADAFHSSGGESPGDHTLETDVFKSDYRCSVLVPEGHQEADPLPTEAENTTLDREQREDPELKPWFSYLEEGELPAEPKLARLMVLEKSRHEIIEGVLYHVSPDGTLKIIPPQSRRRELFNEVHQGPYGAHLGAKKTYGQLSSHYWWTKMLSVIKKWTRSCAVCQGRSTGRKTRPPLTPIPVGGPMDRVGVDVLKLPKSKRGNQYAVVFVDYLSKWPEVYATKDQSSLTIAKLLAREFIPRHGVPRELLSDRGGCFLSNMITDLYQLLGIKKLNTTAYHPQTDGLVERFNRTLISMLAKSAAADPRVWDVKLPYVLFAYRSSPQESTKQSPFHLLYGREAMLPTSVASDSSPDRAVMSVDSYVGEVEQGLQEAWELARKSIARAQTRQKAYYDRKSRKPPYHVGDTVKVHMPARSQGKLRKLALPFEGPYKITRILDTGVEVRSVKRPQSRPIRVAWERVQPYVGEDDPTPLPPAVTLQTTEEESESESPSSCWKTRLRPRQSTTRTSKLETGRCGFLGADVTVAGETGEFGQNP